MLRLHNHSDFFELSVTSEEDSSLQSCGDVKLNLHACSRGFSGEASVWADSEAMRKFCSSLIALEKTLSGQATLESMSPNELALKIFSVNSRGHLGIEASFGHHFVSENGMFWHSVAFGFEFEPSQLSAITRLPWVAKHGG